MKSWNWREDGGLTGQKKEHRYTLHTHTLIHTQQIKWEGAAWRVGQEWKRLQNNGWQGRALDLKMLPSRRNTKQLVRNGYISCPEAAGSFKIKVIIKRYFKGLVFKKSSLTRPKTFSWKTVQNTNGDMNDGPIVLLLAVIKEKINVI